MLSMCRRRGSANPRRQSPLGQEKNPLPGSGESRHSVEFDRENYTVGHKFVNECFARRGRNVEKAPKQTSNGGITCVRQYGKMKRETAEVHVEYLPLHDESSAIS